jgi:hypothetical protein
MSVNPYYVTLVISVVLPVVNGLVFKYTSNPNLLRLANAVLVFVAEAINFALQSDRTYLFDSAWLEWFINSFLALLVSQVTYLSIYVPLKLTSRPDGVLPTNGGVQLGRVRTASEYPAGQAALNLPKAA